MSTKLLSNLVALLTGIFFCLALLAIGEIALMFFWKEKLLADVSYEENYFFTDEFGITKALPDGRYRSTSRSLENGKIIYDVVYSVDEFSRRMVPVDHPELRDKFLIFFGCSFMYGEGLRDDETIPFQTASRTQSFRPHNYAFHGNGATEMLVKLESGTLPTEVKERHGKLVYLFIDAHVQRVIGSMQIAVTWGRNRPYFYLDRDGKIVRKADFLTGRPALTGFYNLISKSRLVRFFKLDFPPVITDGHLVLTARIIEESRRLFGEQFPGSDFYVVIYPGSRYGRRLVRFLNALGVQTLDYTELFNPGEPRYFLSPEDLHPSALADETVAIQLVKDLKLD